MKVVRCGIFMLILLAIFYPVLISKEFVEVKTVVELQSLNEDSVYGPLYYDNATYYKYLSTLKRSPQILALGTSRTLEIKEEFFTEPKSFYNAGYAVENIHEMSNFILNLKDETPQIVIISLDQNFFNAKWNESTTEHYFDYSELAEHEVDFKYTLTNLAPDILSGVYSYSDFLGSPFNIGVNAYTKNHGFLSDGSYYYGNVVDANFTDEERMAGTLLQIEKGELRFQHAQSPKEEAFVMVENLLSLCAEKEIFVIGYLPPFPPSVNERLQNAQHGYLETVPSRLYEIFEGYGFEFYDYTDVSALGCDDSYFIDGIHAGPIVHARMQLDMINKGSVLQHHSDPKTLEMLDENRGSNLVHSA